MKDFKVLVYCAFFSLIVHVSALILLGKINVKSAAISSNEGMRDLEVNIENYQNYNSDSNSKLDLKNKNSKNIERTEEKYITNSKLDNSKYIYKAIKGANLGSQSENHGSEGDESIKGITLAKPDYNYSPKPNYPLMAKKAGYEGKVNLRVKVLENGFVNEIIILTSSGYDILDKAAKEAVYKWKFFPALRDGKPFACWVNVPVRFELE